VVGTDVARNGDELRGGLASLMTARRFERA
jgi:hypothetical protein